MIRWLGLALTGGLALAAASHPARADEERLTLTLRGGAYDRNDDGYADHAAVFGLSGAEVGGGGVIEGGVRVLPRVWLYASWSGFMSQAARRLDQLRVTNQAFLVQAGLTVYRRDRLFGGDLPFSIRVDVLAGGGLYTLHDELDGASHSARGPGARAGSQVTLSWRNVGFIAAYGLHLARASIEDRVGGELRAGGNEVGAGFSVGF
jgi:hypothetical protein